MKMLKIRSPNSEYQHLIKSGVAQWKRAGLITQR